MRPFLSHCIWATHTMCICTIIILIKIIFKQKRRKIKILVNFVGMPTSDSLESEVGTPTQLMPTSDSLESEVGTPTKLTSILINAEKL